jgi:hypothetical protein
MNGHAALSGFIDDGFEGFGPLGRGDLDPEVPAIGESQL